MGSPDGTPLRSINDLRIGTILTAALSSSRQQGLSMRKGGCSSGACMRSRGTSGACMRSRCSPLAQGEGHGSAAALHRDPHLPHALALCATSKRLPIHLSRAAQAPRAMRTCPYSTKPFASTSTQRAGTDKAKTAHCQKSERAHAHVSTWGDAKPEPMNCTMGGDKQEVKAKSSNRGPFDRVCKLLAMVNLSRTPSHLASS